MAEKFKIPQEFKRFGAKLMAVEFYLKSPDDLTAVSSYVHDTFEVNGKPLKVEIKNASTRSLPQNSTYWLWLTELSTQIKLKKGEFYDPEDLHTYMKERFCPNKTLTFGDKTISVKSTKKLDTGEMHFYMNEVHQWAVNAGFSLTIPIESQYREIMERQNA